MSGDVRVGFGTNDVGAYWCPSCEQSLVGAHACPGKPQNTQPPSSAPTVSPFVDRPGFIPNPPLSEQQIRQIVREEIKRALPDGK